MKAEPPDFRLVARLAGKGRQVIKLGGIALGKIIARREFRQPEGGKAFAVHTFDKNMSGPGIKGINVQTLTAQRARWRRLCARSMSCAEPAKRAL